MKSTRSVTPRRARPVLGNPTYVTPHYHSRVWAPLMFVLLIVGLVGIVGVGGGSYWLLHRAQSGPARTTTVRVVAGESVGELADRLHTAGLLDNPLLFRVDARLHRLGGKLEVGYYHLRGTMSIDQMVSTFAAGSFIPSIRLTIPEGWRAEQMAARIQARGINVRQFLDAVTRPTLHDPILASKPSGASLEGYLFPDTYDLPPHVKAQTVVARMVERLGKVFTPKMRADAARKGFSVYKVLILASIVEREARVDSERGIIASVYENRLHQGMGLYADPTVQYAVGTPGHWWPVLTTDQLKVNSPYNTYMHPGLPPGPIASPGLKSIMATIYPRSTDFLYFVAKGNGYHAFARTYAEQLANQQKYQH